jgi:hypothetical protein
MTHYLGEDGPNRLPQLGSGSGSGSGIGSDHQLVPVTKIQPAETKMDHSPLHDLHATKAIRAKPESRKKNHTVIFGGNLLSYFCNVLFGGNFVLGFSYLLL